MANAKTDELKREKNKNRLLTEARDLRRKQKSEVDVAELIREDRETR